MNFELNFGAFAIYVGHVSFEFDGHCLPCWLWIMSARMEDSITIHRTK